MAYIGQKPANKPVVASDLDSTVISGQTELATAPADTDELLISDAGTLKRIDASLIGGGVDGITSSADATAITIDSSENVSISQNLKFNSGFGSSATAYGVRAWVRFDGTGTVGIDGSGNVSSITDSSAGTYEVNFTNNMPDTNYVPVGSPSGELISTSEQKFGAYFTEGHAVNTFRLSVRQIDNDAPTMTSSDADPCFIAVIR